MTELTQKMRESINQCFAEKRSIKRESTTLSFYIANSFDQCIQDCTNNLKAFFEEDVINLVQQPLEPLEINAPKVIDPVAFQSELEQIELKKTELLAQIDETRAGSYSEMPPSEKTEVTTAPYQLRGSNGIH